MDTRLRRLRVALGLARPRLHLLLLSALPEGPETDTACARALHALDAQPSPSGAVHKTRTGAPGRGVKLRLVADGGGEALEALAVGLLLPLDVQGYAGSLRVQAAQDVLDRRGGLSGPERPLTRPCSRLHRTPCPLLVLLLRPDDESLSVKCVEEALALGCASEAREWAVVDIRDAHAGLAWLTGAALAASRPTSSVPRASAASLEAPSSVPRSSRRLSSLTALLMGRE